MASKKNNQANRSKPSFSSKKPSKKRKKNASTKPSKKREKKNAGGEAQPKLLLEDAQRLLTHAIMEQDKDLPEHLQFKVVLPHPNGKNEKLSPPQYEFSDGIYLIVAPAHYHDSSRYSKKCKLTKQEYVSLLPPYLHHHVVDDWPSDLCDWSLSGPQYLKDGALQQRYCYPTGREEYHSTKGASLYTAYMGGKEIYSYRILHVYYSTKRAKNQRDKGNPSKQKGSEVRLRKKNASRREVAPRLKEHPEHPLPQLPEEPELANEEVEHRRLPPHRQRMQTGFNDSQRPSHEPHDYLKEICLSDGATWTTDDDFPKGFDDKLYDAKSYTLRDISIPQWDSDLPNLLDSDQVIDLFEDFDGPAREFFDGLDQKPMASLSTKKVHQYPQTARPKSPPTWASRKK